MSFATHWECFACNETFPRETPPADTRWLNRGASDVRVWFCEECA